MTARVGKIDRDGVLLAVIEQDEPMNQDVAEQCWPIPDGIEAEPGALRWFRLSDQGDQVGAWEPIVWVAQLAEDGLYLGCEPIAREALTEAHVVLPWRCDLEPGKYRYTQGAFMPLGRPAVVDPDPCPVNPSEVLLDLLDALNSQGTILPRSARELMAWRRRRSGKPEG